MNEDMPWVIGLTDEEVQELRTNKQELTQYGKEKIFKLMEEHFHLCPIHDSNYIEWVGVDRSFLKFAHQIRKQTLEEVISVLQNVPNPEANRAAINRIETELNR
jgi:hypothetical protein